MSTVERGADVIRSFGEEVGLNIWTPIHERWRLITNPLGGVIKPTGAGGDDLTLLASESAEAEKNCLRALHEDTLREGIALQVFRLGR